MCLDSSCQCTLRPVPSARKPVWLGDSIDDWWVCWLGGWDKGRAIFVVMVCQLRRTPEISRRSQLGRGATGGGLFAKDKTSKDRGPGLHGQCWHDTDNQTLSEARAKAVVVCLAKPCVATRPQSAHGYGKTKLVADNGKDKGRAKDRRLEIADPACAPAPARR